MVLWSGLRLTMATPATTGTCRESNVRIEMVMMIFFRFNAMTDEIVSNDFLLTDFFRILKSRKSHLRKVAQVAARLPTELKDLVRVPANSNFG